MVDFSLSGKIALVTGASRGIGEAIATTLAANGAHCLLVSRKAEGLEAVAGKIRAAGGQADVLTCNTGILNQIAELMEQVKSRFGKLDILVNNAATNPFFGEMVGADEGVWDKTFGVNVKGPFFLIQQAAPLMAASGGGAIVNVASIAGLRPGLYQGIYSITKAALIMLTKAYAQELAGKNIRVNALLPGLTETKFAKVLIETKEIHDAAVSQIPLRRHAQPSEMAGAVLYLVSNASSYTTGTTIVCDGGMTI